jgi:hypothetical protein
MIIQDITKHHMAKIANALSQTNYTHKNQQVLEMFASKKIHTHEIDSVLNLDRGTAQDMVTAYLVHLKWEAEFNATNFLTN